MARDNFTKAVIEKLRTRVANRCSNPSCRVPTTGPSANKETPTIIGVASHITAAAIGGPRYDPTLTEKARKSMDNGIWLCSNCSVLIDRDIGTHSVELLKQWKIEAEQLAKQELGKKLPHKNDAVDTLTTALTGQSTRLIPDAISNVHKASAKVLEALDPRFAVKSTFSDGITNFKIFAKQDVSVSMNIKEEYAQEYSDKFKQLIEHGLDLTISGSAINFEGSRLLEEISANLANGTLKLSPKKTNATQKIWLINKSSSLVENFDDVYGEITPGRQTVSFSGTACGDIFTFNYQLNTKTGSNNATVNVTIGFTKWANLDVRALPYFNKIFGLLEKMTTEWDLITALEISGSEVFRSKGFTLDSSEMLINTFQVLSIIEDARRLARSTNTRIVFNPSFSFTDDEYNSFRNAVSIANGKVVFRESDFRGNISTDYVVDKEYKSLEKLLQCREPMDFEFVETNESTLRIFGQDILLPKKIWRIKAVRPLIGTIDVEQLAHGDIVKIEWVPAEGFEARIEFEKSTH